MPLEHRSFIQYKGLSDIDQSRWIEWCNMNVGLIEHDWWMQDVTDNWDGNTSCWYFKDKETADKFGFYVKLTRNNNNG